MQGTLFAPRADAADTLRALHNARIKRPSCIRIPQCRAVCPTCRATRPDSTIARAQRTFVTSRRGQAGSVFFFFFLVPNAGDGGGGRDGGKERNPLYQARNLAQTGKETARRAQDFHFHPLCALWVSGLNRNPAQISKANTARRLWTSLFTWPSTFMRRRATHKWSAPALRLDTQWPCAGRVSMGLMSTVLDCLRAFADVREAGCHGLQ